MRYNSKLGKEIDTPKIDAFLEEVNSVCIKHGFSIMHEDTGGNFEVAKYSSDDSDWLLGANDNTDI
jgi:hypothetical protein